MQDRPNSIDKKRLFDIVASGALLVAAAPVMLVVALLVRWRLGSPVLFTQERAGRGGVPFNLLKFRSMTDERDAAGELLPDKQRLPPFGLRLRASSLDELPQLLNVLAGHMSLVGPRPLFMHYLPLYSTEQRRRLEVRPGLTGWAQVNGRNALSWNERFAHDVWYVDHQSLALDLRILWRTFVRVITRDGVSQEGHVTMEPFKGAETTGASQAADAGSKHARLLVLGAGGHGKVVADCARATGRWREIRLYDDALEAGTVRGAWQTFGKLPDLIADLGPHDEVFVAIGRSQTRLRVLQELAAQGATVAVVIHPAAVVSPGVSIGAGSLVVAGAVVNVDARIGRGCIVNTRASVDHDCALGDGVHVCPGATLAGTVTVGPGAWIGAGSTVREGITIGVDAFVAAGAVVVRDVPDGVTVAGIPARPLQRSGGAT